jgi:hypothetical protein
MRNAGLLQLLDAATMGVLFQQHSRGMRQWKFMKAKTFDRKFEAVEKMADQLTR